jgi:hypothetical protein
MTSVYLRGRGGALAGGIDGDMHHPLDLYKISGIKNKKIL